MSTNCHSVSESHDAFLQMLPRIRACAARRFRGHDREQREELTAEAVALAFDMYRRLVERGMPQLAYATPLGVYACRQVVSGRRLGGSLNVNDVGSTHCVVHVRLRVVHHIGLALGQQLNLRFVHMDTMRADRLLAQNSRF